MSQRYRFRLLTASGRDDYDNIQVLEQVADCSHRQRRMGVAVYIDRGVGIATPDAMLGKHMCYQALGV